MNLAFLSDRVTIDAFGRLTESLLHFVWQGAVIAVIAMTAARCLRGHSAAWRYAVQVATLLLMLVCVPATYYTLQRQRNDDIRAAAGVAEGELVASQVATANFGTSPARQESIAANTHRHADRAELPVALRAEMAWGQLRAVARSWAPYAVTAYLFGVILMLGRLAVAMAAGHRLSREAHPVIETEVLSMVSRQARRAGLRAAPVVAWCKRTSVPLVAGLVKPMILLPVGLASGLAPDQLEALLAHELAHVRRFDLLVNLLQRLAEAVLFFHPAVWYVSRWISRERENCCDDSVLHAGWGRLEYADALVRMAELSAALRGMGGINSAALLAAAGHDPSQFKQRILRLFDEEERLGLGLSRGGALAILGVAVASVLAFPALNRAPSLLAQSEEIPRVDTPADKEQEPVIPPDHYLLSFRETPWKDVLRWYGRVMNQNIVLNVVPTGNVSYENPRPLNHSEIIQLVNGELLRQGFCFVEEGDGLSVQPADVIARTYEDELRNDFMHGYALRKGSDTFDSYFEIVDCRVVRRTKAPAPPGPAIAYVLKARRDFSAQEATDFWRSCMPEISITSLPTGQPVVADGFAILYNGEWLGTKAPPLRKGERIEVWQNRFEEWNARQPADLHVMIEGRIVGPGGTPVAARVRQFLMEGVSEDEGDDLRGFLNWAYAGDLIVAKQGTFQVSLRHGTQFVRTAYLYAFAPGYAPQRIGPIAVGYEKAAAPLTIELKPGFSARIRLIRADGTALEEGEVEVAAQDDLQAPGIPMTKLPIDGKPISVMDCPLGPLMLTVRVPGFAEQVVRDVRLTADQLAEVTVPAIPQKPVDKPPMAEQKPANQVTENKPMDTAPEMKRVLTPDQAIRKAENSTLTVEFRVQFVTKAILIKLEDKKDAGWVNGHSPKDMCLRPQTPSDRKQAKFLAILTESTIKEFTKVGIQDIEKHFSGKTVRVTGRTSTKNYRGYGTPPEVEIVIDDMRQLEVVHKSDPGAGQRPAADTSADGTNEQPTAAKRSGDPNVASQDEKVNILCLDQDGNPVAGAEVHLFQDVSAEPTRYEHFGPFTSDEKGHAACPRAVVCDERGQFDRWAYARVPGRLVGVARSVNWKNRSPINPKFRVQLQPSRSVEGFVTVPDGFAPPQATVRVQVLKVNTGQGDFDYQSFPRHLPFAGLDTALSEVFDKRPDAEGRIRFDDVPVNGDLYLVSVDAGMAEAQWWNESKAFDEPIRVAISKEGILTGRVESPEGKPAAGLEVAVRLSHDGHQRLFFLSTFRAITDANGEFAVHGLPDARFELHVEDPSRRWTVRPRESLLVASGETKDVTVSMEDGVAVSGRVFDPDGKPVEGAALSALADTQGAPGLAGDMTDRDGRYRLRLPSGRAYLYFNSLPDGFDYPKPQIIKRLDITAGQDAVEGLDFTIPKTPKDGAEAKEPSKK